MNVYKALSYVPCGPQRVHSSVMGTRFVHGIWQRGKSAVGYLTELWNAILSQKNYFQCRGIKLGTDFVEERTYGRARGLERISTKRMSKTCQAEDQWEQRHGGEAFHFFRGWPVQGERVWTGCGSVKPETSAGAPLRSPCKCLSQWARPLSSQIPKLIN